MMIRRKSAGNNPIRVAYISDPLEQFNIKKDSTYMMMQAAQKRRWQQYVLEMNDLRAEDGVAFGSASLLHLSGNRKQSWYELETSKTFRLDEFDVILMRKDPPFNLEYIYATYMLALAEQKGALVVNKPSALRNWNEKFSIMRYPEFSPNTLITRSFTDIYQFLSRYRDIIVKPLDGMGGESVFRIRENDVNRNVILETMTCNQTRFIMAQEYQPAIREGDKRILIFDGEPLEYLVARIPDPTDGRGNTARGAQTQVKKLTLEEYDIAASIGKDLKAEGILFAGIDMIGHAVTEINITSPTMIQQIYHKSGVNAADILMEIISDKLTEK